VLYLPQPDAQAGIGRLLLEGEPDKHGRDWRSELAAFTAETGRIFDLLSGFLPEIGALDGSDTLSYLHSAISTRAQRVSEPKTPFYLDAFLVDEPLSGGMEPTLGDHHLRVLTVLGFPNLTRPGLLDALNRLGFPYRWMTRFLSLERSDATRLLTKIRRQWFNKRKSVTALLREVLYNQPSTLLDSDAENKVVDADLAIQAVGGDDISFGYLTIAIVVSDRDRTEADRRIREIERVLHGLGFTAIREGINAVEAWLGSLPGHVYANVRQPPVHTLNLAHLIPLSALWAGPHTDSHLDGPPLLVAETSGETPFRLAIHVGDVGHMMVVGPTGAGKSVLLALLALQFRRYTDAQIFVFDTGLSARATVLAMGGQHHRLGLGSEAEPGTALQPLRAVDAPEERAWAVEWLGALVERQNVLLTPELKDALWSALESLASAPAEQRTLTGLVSLLQVQALKSSLSPYTLEGPFGKLLDAAESGLTFSDVQCFEMEDLLRSPGAAGPVLSYLFHRLEERFDGRPTLLILDEAWVYLDHPQFAARIREWLKVLRKKNVSVVFATQSLADIMSSAIAPAVVESCPQRIFLPNDRAIEPQSREIYARFGLNERQIGLIATSTPKRDYYLQSRRGNRLFDLNLGPVALSLCGTSDPESQKLIDELMARVGGRGFLAELLTARRLEWAADLLDQFPNPVE
jgi:type IV secretion system protein TrbE